MPVYAKKTTVEDQYGARRAPGGVILCSRCNCNLADIPSNPAGTIYVIYTDKKHLTADIPHDVYCESCLASDFSKAKIV